MRARLLKPGFFANEELGCLPLAARLLFAGLWCLADREGRLEDRPHRIKVEVFPYDVDVDVRALLDELAGAGLIIRYDAAGKHCLWLPTFLTHQRVHLREAPSTLPPCPQEETGVPKANLGEAQGSPGQTKVSGYRSGKEAVTVTEAEAVTEEGEPRLAAGAAALDSDFGRICSCFEDNGIGKLTPASKTRLEELSYDYSADWFEAAVKEAVTHNARNLAYVEAVLKRWEKEGFQSGVPPGKGKRHGQVMHGTPRARLLSGGDRPLLTGPPAKVGAVLQKEASP